MPTNRGSTRCVGTGFIVLDVIRTPIDTNTTLERRHAGGSCGNVLAILSYLDVPSSSVGRIGEDAAGAELLTDLRRWKVDTRLLVAEPGRRTPVVIQESFTDARGRARHRFSRACPVCGATMPGYRPLLATHVADVADALPAHSVFYFDRVAAGTLELARRSREQGALVVFEPSGIKNEETFIECLRTAHILKYSHERLASLDHLVGQARVPMEVRTLGPAGLQFRVRRSGRLEAWRQLAALEAPSLRDAAGSGDWCTAGLISKLMDEANGAGALEDVETVGAALRYGQAFAALNCAYDGARGLMYAMSHTTAEKAAAQVLASERPRLPDAAAAERPPRVSDASCIVCTSAIRGPHP